MPASPPARSGRNASTATDGQLKAEIWSWSRARGLFAGVALDGAVLAIDDAANEAVYGRGTTPRMIFEGRARSGRPTRWSLSATGWRKPPPPRAARAAPARRSRSAAPVASAATTPPAPRIGRRRRPPRSRSRRRTTAARAPSRCQPVAATTLDARREPLPPTP